MKDVFLKKLALVTFGLAITGSGFAGASKEPMSAEQLRNGLVRFALANNELAPVLNSASRLEGPSADFLRAQLLLASGRTEDAISELKAVIDGDYHRADAALLLGKTLLHYQDPEAQQWLELAVRVGGRETGSEAGFYLAELHRSNGHSEKAGQVLGGLAAGYWAAVGYMNLASDYAREDLNAVRALVSLRVALAMAEQDPEVSRRKVLTGRLLVRAGYLALQNNDYDKAISFLEGVSLDGDNNLTAQALYFHGLALSKKGSSRAAMQSWHRAKKYPLAYPGVADSWIGMGRGYDLSGYLGQSGEAYLAATAALESERVTLRNLAEQIREGGAYNTLLAKARDTGVEWFLADHRIKTQPRIAYLHELLQEPEAQKAVSRVAELDAVGSELEREARDLDVFIRSLKSQLTTLSRQKPDVVGGLLSTQRFLHKELSALSAQPLSAIQRARLDAVAETLAETSTDLTTFGRSVQNQPLELERLLAEARSLKSSTERLYGQVQVLRREADRQLDELALEFVSEQDRRMVLVQDKAEQQIAHLYEYLAVSKMEGREP
ncbi:hypothetical protein [Marinobacter sp. F4216]|uniref:hypothetical protein n=1 Tax=Marinobacter sp. F4216 TaxID=2874281 RepID=UPI001CBBCAF9|nr:hypothetical protein [Marinobacter sp. F4216]MBZ2167894.1 hypothetical protein [Marinobacter sp. F4216]